MKLLTVRHATTYRYARPVTFGQHRLMLRPRDSHDMRLVAAELTLSPPGKTRWMYDVFGNSVALVDFTQPAAELLASSARCKLERYGHRRPGVSDRAGGRDCIPSSIRAATASISAACSSSTIPIRRACWRAGPSASSAARPMRTLDLLAEHERARSKPVSSTPSAHEQGTQSPIETLQKKQRRLPRLRHVVHRGRAQSRLRRAFRLRLSVRPGARRRRRHARRRPRRTPGRRSICRAPAGSSTTRPMG